MVQENVVDSNERRGHHQEEAANRGRQRQRGQTHQQVNQELRQVDEQLVQQRQTERRRCGCSCYHHHHRHHRRSADDDGRGELGLFVRADDGELVARRVRPVAQSVHTRDEQGRAGQLRGPLQQDKQRDRASQEEDRREQGGPARGAQDTQESPRVRRDRASNPQLHESQRDADDDQEPRGQGRGPQEARQRLRPKDRDATQAVRGRVAVVEQHEEFCRKRRLDQA